MCTTQMLNNHQAILVVWSVSESESLSVLVGYRYHSLIRHQKLKTKVLAPESVVSSFFGIGCSIVYRSGRCTKAVGLSLEFSGSGG